MVALSLEGRVGWGQRDMRRPQLRRCALGGV